MSDLRILSVCTHNRTRSVLIGALLGEHLARRGLVADIVTGGFREEGLPATEQTVRLLAARGIDVSDHRSKRVTRDLVAETDLIVTAERDHVVWIAGDNRGSFARTFTLPELLSRAEMVGARRAIALDEWLERVNTDRPMASQYLMAPIPEVADPTGQAPSVWEHALQEIDALCQRLAAVLT